MPLIGMRLDVERDAVKLQLASALTSLQHRLRQAIEDLATGERIDANLITNASSITYDIARWNLTRELLPLADEQEHDA